MPKQHEIKKDTRHTMRKLFMALFAGILTITGVTLAAAPANAAKGSPKCMTFSEWRKIKANDTMTRAMVKRITGISGKVTNRTYYGDGTYSVDIDYRQCLKNGKPARGSWNTVWLSYDNYHYSWDYSQEYRTNLRVDYKGSWSTPSVW